MDLVGQHKLATNVDVPIDSPLSSKVAMFNNKVDEHQNSQLLNPFSQDSGRKSPRLSVNREEYGKPLAGSLTEMRGQRANMHVWKEMYDLCRIIDDEGTPNPDDPSLKAILFGEIFNIYTHISDKVVGLLLRARKHGLLNFEGEMLFQRRDDAVPIYMIKPIVEIRQMVKEKEGELSRSVSPSPQPTTILMNTRSRNPSPAPPPLPPK